METRTLKVPKSTPATIVLMSDEIPTQDTERAGSRLSRRSLLASSAAIVAATGPVSAAAPAANIQSDRDYQVAILKRLAEPVLTALSARRLRQTMPVEAALGADPKERAQYTHLEAIGRLLMGIAPWLEAAGVASTAEEALRVRYAELARKAIAAAVDPASPDYLNFSKGAQPVVDAAFLALALLRAPRELWKKLSTTEQAQVIAALQSTRVIKPGFNNWLLFSATIEAFLGYAGVFHDDMRIDYAVRQHEEWYKGDGLYGDGPQFHWDYYNSYVIHPMLLQVLETASAWTDAWRALREPVQERAVRYAAIQERLIGPDGTFPPIGRSLAYRCGAFHLLADMSLRKQLPPSLRPAAVRSALTAVIKRTLDAPETFDSRGWLTIGLCGHQPAIAERYISTGSLYLCAVALLPLGLPPADSFWAAPPVPWTQQQTWTGKPVQADHAL